jgi:hypothetical protein
MLKINIYEKGGILLNIKLIGEEKVVMTNTESHHAYFA